MYIATFTEPSVALAEAQRDFGVGLLKNAGRAVTPGFDGQEIVINASTLRVLVLGATGMLGHTVFRRLAESEGIDAYGSVRRPQAIRLLPGHLAGRLIGGVDVENFDSVERCLSLLRPDIVVNCVGVIKQSTMCDDAVATVEINGVVPHRLAVACQNVGARFIHVSTDCVFSGARGLYSETDMPDPVDLYGRSKLVGEPSGQNVLTLRTSFIGHELSSAGSLLDWFLGQHGTVPGYVKAIYSGVTTLEFARLLTDVIFSRPELIGVYHVASQPISKFDLLQLVKSQYAWAGHVIHSEEVMCDRSMTADKLLEQTGYAPPNWPAMIRQMRTHRDMELAR